METSAEYYNILRVPIDATMEEIRAAYFAAVRVYHPDVNASLEAHQTFVRIQEAYEVLSNPQKRATYDASIPPEYRRPPPVVSEIYLSRETLPRLSEPQLVYLFLSMHTTASPDPAFTPPVHIYLVVDRSTSMRGERIEMVRQSIAHLVRNLRPRDLLSLIVFSDRAEVVFSAVPVQHQIDILHQVNQIQVSGGTEILRGLEAALDLARHSNHAGQGLAQIWLITDGHTYGDEQACIELAANARKEGITIHAFGIGEDWNDEFLDALTSFSGGNTYYVQRGEDLYTYFERKGRNAEIIFARNLELQFASDPGIGLRYAFRIGDEIAPLQTSSPIPLGDLYFGRKVDVIVELILSPLRPELERVVLMRGKLQMEVLSAAARYWRIPLEITCSVSDQITPQRVPEPIIQALSRLTLYRLQEKARQEVASGDVTRAARRLQYLATHLLAKGERELARTVLLEAEYLQRTHQMSEERGKQIKYGTRALLMLPEPGEG